MSKKWYSVNVIILCLFIIGIIVSTKPNNNNKLRTINNTITKNIVTPINTNKIDDTNTISPKPTISPVAKIIIPKINLNKNLYNKESKENNVDKNVTILKESIFPDNSNSIVFLAAHSGPGANAYFNNIDKLEINDYLILQYKNYNYYYTIDKIFTEKKDGDIEINKSSDNQLILTTCSKTNKEKQLIINSNLKRKEEIT